MGMAPKRKVDHLSENRDLILIFPGLPHGGVQKGRNHSRGLLRASSYPAGRGSDLDAGSLTMLSRQVGPQIASDRPLPGPREIQPSPVPAPGVRIASCASARTGRYSSIFMFAPSKDRAQPHHHPQPSTRSHQRLNAPQSPTLCQPPAFSFHFSSPS